jgi:hypothetical protein
MSTRLVRIVTSVHFHYRVTTNHGPTWVDYVASVPGVAGLSGARVHFFGATRWLGTCETTGSGAHPGPSTPTPTPRSRRP